jgi:hypothetical protein
LRRRKDVAVMLKGDVVFLDYQDAGARGACLPYFLCFPNLFDSLVRPTPAGEHAAALPARERCPCIAAFREATSDDQQGSLSDRE